MLIEYGAGRATICTRTGLASTNNIRHGTVPSKGMSSVEVAVTRVIKGEVTRQSVTLLLDLKGFYENVDHAA